MEILRFKPIIKNMEDALKAHYSSSARRIESVELIHLPFCLFNYDVVRRRWFSSEISDKALLLVDMVNGIPINVPSQVEFEDSGGAVAPLLSGIDRSRATRIAGRGLKMRVSRIAVEKADVEERSAIKPLLNDEEAIRRGLWALRYDLMRVWGPLRYRSIKLAKSDKDAVTMHFPYWMLYYRKAGRMHFDALDALSGVREGTQIKMSIVKGMSSEGQDGGGSPPTVFALLPEA